MATRTTFSDTTAASGGIDRWFGFLLASLLLLGIVIAFGFSFEAFQASAEATSLRSTPAADVPSDFGFANEL